MPIYCTEALPGGKCGCRANPSCATSSSRERLYITTWPPPDHASSTWGPACCAMRKGISIRSRGDRALARPPLPSGLEQWQRIFLLIRVLGDLLQIEIRPQSRRLRHLNVAVHHLYRMSDDMLLPRLVEFIEDLVDEEIRERRIQ